MTNSLVRLVCLSLAGLGFAMLQRSHPEAAQRFLAQAQQEAERRFKAYQDMALRHADESKPGA